MTNLEIITSALRMLSVLDANETASDEDAQVGLEQMNDFMSLLLADSIDLGYTAQTDVLDVFPLDDVIAAQLKPLLAVHLHAFYPASTVPDSLPMRAQLAKDQLTRASVLANMEEASMSNIPLGEAYAPDFDITTRT